MSKINIFLLIIIKIININLVMSYLRTIDPLKGLKGKLNFLKYQNQPLLEILKLANTLSSKAKSQSQTKSSLNSISVEEINNLAGENKVSDYEHKKMLFEAHVHKHANLNTPIGTIYQQLDKHQKRLVLTLLKFSDKLNARQMSYLQYAFRHKINSLYPNWSNLHLNPQSPLRKQLTVIPNILSMRYLYDLKLLPKKTVMSKIAESRPKVEKKVPEPAKAASAPAQEKGKSKGK